MNVKFQIVTDTDSVLMENAFASEDTKENFAKKVRENFLFFFIFLHEILFI